MNRIHRLLHRFTLGIFFGAAVFLINLLTIALTMLGLVILSAIGVIARDGWLVFPGIYFAAICLVAGTILAFVFHKPPMEPLKRIMDAVDRVADGDYSVRVNLRGPEGFRQLGRKFNRMTEELSSVELLRSDFINNFSHEFKTPISSILGFAQILRDKDLTPEEQAEYLDIIIKESQRLTALSTNVLNLSKIEQQSILTDRKHCDISEQLRTAIIALDVKWIDKQIEFQMDEEEVYATVNEELLQQVWLNLLDNAIKFSPEGGTVRVKTDILASDRLKVTISNMCDVLTEDTKLHLFDKFYQGDTSHTAEGNGLGLALVKKIIELHNGEILVDTTIEDWVSFEIKLPIE